MTSSSFPVGEARPRRWWAAAILGMIIPGFGHMYVGRWKTALAIGVLVATIHLPVLAWFVVGGRDVGPMLQVAGTFAWTARVAQAAHAAWLAHRIGAAYKTTHANHPGAYGAFVVLTLFVVGRLIGGALAQAMFLVVQVPDPSREPALPQGTQIYVETWRFDPAAVAPGALVAYDAGAGAPHRVALGCVAAVRAGERTVVVAGPGGEKGVPFDDVLGRGHRVVERASLRPLPEACAASAPAGAVAPR